MKLDISNAKYVSVYGGKFERDIITLKIMNFEKFKTVFGVPIAPFSEIMTEFLPQLSVEDA